MAAFPPLPYYHPVREKVQRYIQEQALMRAGDRVAVAVSGGADSVALLRLLIELRTELGIVLAVAHFNHGLRGEQSAADEAFVAELAKAHGLDFLAGRGSVRDHAFTNKRSIEAAGRELRYRWFAQLAEEQRFDCVATAHTLDDQAETVLLKLLRGAGTKGLAGIYPILDLKNQKDICGAREVAERIEEQVPLQTGTSAKTDLRLRIVRPLLCVSRDEVEAYLTALHQSWREDDSNLDRRFLRNRVRHELLPLLEREYNPNIRQVLSDAAQIAQAEEEYWQQHVERELDAHGEPSSRLKLEGFVGLPLALQRRLLKRFAEREGVTLDFEHVEKLRRCAMGEMLRAELPGGHIAAHARGWLQLRAPAQDGAPAYLYVLPVAGEVRITELSLTLRATIVPEGFARELPPEELLNRDLLGTQLAVRNWRPGDRFWPAHSRSEKKLKRLFADKQIPPEERVSWPVALHEGEIVWVRNFPVARAYRWKGEGDAARIEIL